MQDQMSIVGVMILGRNYDGPARTSPIITRLSVVHYSIILARKIILIDFLGGLRTWRGWGRDTLDVAGPKQNMILRLHGHEMS